MSDLKSKIVKIIGEPRYNSHKQSAFMYGDDVSDEVSAQLKEAGINYKVVQQHGGEGEGDTYYSVWKFSDDNEVLFISFNGWYASFDGATYNDYTFVKPKEITITVYE